MKVTQLSGTDYPVTDETYAATVWLLKQYTSFAYIERCCRLLATFNREYERFAGAGKTQFPPAGYRRNLVRQYDYQSRLERGLALLGIGDKSGYREISEGSEFSSFIFGRGNEYGDNFDEVGYRPRPGPSIGIFTWAERASAMAVFIRWTLRVEWTFERCFVPPVGPPPPLPNPVPPLIRPHKVLTIGKGDEVPTNGIWQPIDVPKGCPNYLRPGMKGVPVEVPSKRYDDPLLPGEPNNPRLRSVVDYEFKAVPTRWQLLWEDTRYKNGVIPDESEYLDSSTAFPDDGIAPAPGIPR